MGRPQAGQTKESRSARGRWSRALVAALLASVLSQMGGMGGAPTGVSLARADDEPGGSWRYRDERGRVFFTDNPESIPPRYKGSAARIAPVEPERAMPSDKAAEVVQDAERALRDAIPDGRGAVTVGGGRGGAGGGGGVGGGGGSSDFPFATIAVVAGEAILIRIAARMTGLTIGLPGVAVACCAAAFLQSLHVPLLSSFGSFLVLFLLLWRLGRADGAETVALFMVVVAFLHVLSLYMLVRLPRS